MAKLTKEETLAKAAKRLMLESPFYGLFLVMLNKTWSKQIPTACVSKNGINYQLTINEDYWAILTDDQQRGALKHELLHITFFHLLIDRGRYSHKDILAIAVDLEVNQYIRPEDTCKDWIFLSTYPELNLEPKKGFLYYYEKLMQAHKDGTSPNLDQQLAAMAMQGGRGVLVLGPGGEHLPDHSLWSEFDSLSEAEKKLVQKQLDYQLQEVADSVVKSRGTIPSELEEYIRKLSHKEPPKFDWRGYLRRFAGGSTKVYTKKLRRKFNKRFEDNPGLKIKPRKHVLVAVDTSGSVSGKELVEFFHEIDHIHRTGAEVTIVQADAAISHISPYKKGLDVVIHGRGGTDFQPVIDYYSRNLNKYTCLIYFTDGEAPAPDKPLGKLLWVLSSQSKETDHLPGSTIQLN